ncbi:MAG: calcium-binding protein, partial [Chloroflexi bacterium]|nr:calcium-binding protein [Chloroflexota bacterium]
NMNTLVGSAFADTLTGPNAVNVWKVTAADAGTLNDILAFASVENLTGSDQTDRFVFADGAGIAGEADGGLGSDNTLDYSAYSQVNPVTVDLGAGTATGTAGIRNFQYIIGGSGADTLTGDQGLNHITGGPGNDTLTGGLGDDVFYFGDNWGDDLVNEALGGGTDTLDFGAVTADLTFTFSGVLTVADGSGQKVTHAADNIEKLVAGSGRDTFAVLDGVTFSGNLDGGSDEDTLDLSNYSSSVTIDLAAGRVTAGGISLTVENVEQFIGGKGDDLLISGSADEVLVGGPGDDTYVFTDGWGDDTVIELGAGGVDTFDFSAVTRDMRIVLGSVIAEDGFGNRTTYTGDSVENVIGGAGDDTIIFSADGVILAGGAGTIDGGLGQNTLDYSAYTSPVHVDLAAGTATGTAGIQNIQHIIGGSGDDVLTGDAADNQISGLAGADTINGGAGVDTLLGGDGNDVLHGGDGNDTLSGNAGADQLFGDAGDDLLDGNQGDDTLNGGLGNDTLTDLLGNNILQGDAGDDTLTGGAGADTLLGGTGDDVLNGGLGDDTLSGGEGQNTYRFDTVFGQDRIVDAVGFDIIDFSTFSNDLTVTIGDQLVVADGAGSQVSASGAEIERLLTGSGDDTFVFENGGRMSGQIDAGSGADVIDFSLYQTSRSVYLTNPGADEGWAGSAGVLGGFDNIETVVGSAAADTLTGVDAAAIWDVTTPNVYRYTSGGSTLNFSNFENLVGGSGADVFQVAGSQTLNLFGQGGDDRFVFADGAVLTGSINGGTGSDVFDLSASTQGLDISLTNVGSVDSFVGTVAGLVSRFDNLDQIIAGSGQDTLTGLNAASQWILDATTSYQNAGETFVFSGVDMLNGGSGVDTFRISSSQALSLNGGLGNDLFVFENDAILTGSISGGGGHDTFDFSNYVTAASPSGLDVWMDLSTGGANFAQGGVSNVDKVIGSMGGDWLVGGSTAVEFYGGDGADVLIGGDGNDWLYGGAGNDIILGGAGDDTIYGGAGIDQLDGGLGADTMIFDDNWGIDIIANGAGSTNDTVDFSGVSDPITFVLSNVVAKTGRNIVAHAGSKVRRVIGTNGNDVIILSPQTLNTSMTVDAGPGIDTFDYSNFLGSVYVNFVSGQATGLAGFTSVEGVIGGSGNDRFVAGSGHEVIWGSGGYDVAVDVRCGSDVVGDIESVQCYQPSKLSALRVYPIIIIVHPDTGRIPVPYAGQINLIDFTSLGNVYQNMGDRLLGLIKYQYHLDFGPRFRPEAGNLVELPVGAGTSVSLVHIGPVSSQTGQSLILGNDRMSLALAATETTNSGLRIIAGKEQWVHSSSGTTINLGEFVELPQSDVNRFGDHNGLEKENLHLRFISGMEIRVTDQDMELGLLKQSMTVSFSITAETIKDFDWLGILYYDDVTGDYILLEEQIVYWDENANGGLGGWVSEPPSPDATGRIFTEQGMTGTYMLVGISYGAE